MEAAGRSFATTLAETDEEQPGAGDAPGASTVTGRVLVVAEHALIATGLRLALTTREWDVEICDGPAPEDVIEHARRFAPDCVLIDVHHRTRIGSGIDLIAPLRATGTHVVMLTAERRRTVLGACVDAGAAGWIGAGSELDEVDSALRRVKAGGSLLGRTERAALLEALRLERERERCLQAMFDELSEREALVLAALSDGLCAEEIAREHFVAMTTVRSQIRAVLQKLGVRSQLAAVSMAAAHRELLPHRGDEPRDRRRADRREHDVDAGATASIA